MNTDLMNIADMNTVAVAYYCQGYSDIAIQATVATLAKLSEIRCLEEAKQKEQRTKITHVSASNDAATESNSFLNREKVSGDANQYSASECSEHRCGMQNQAEERAIMISTSFRYDYGDSGYTVSLTNQVDEGTNVEDYQDVITTEDPWTYGEMMFYTGRTTTEYVLTVYALQSGSKMMPSIELFSTEQAVHEFTSPTYMNNSLLDSYVGLYDAAFLLTNDIPYLYEETAGIVSFNLGLILHRDAIISTNGNETKALFASLQLYQQALLLLGQDKGLDFVCILKGENPPFKILTTADDISVRFWYQKSVTLATVTAAIYCNIADIYCRYQTEPNKKIVLLYRLNAVVRFLDTENGTTQEDLSFFHLGFSCLMSSLKNPSPAA